MSDAATRQMFLSGRRVRTVRYSQFFFVLLPVLGALPQASLTAMIGWFELHAARPASNTPYITMRAVTRSPPHLPQKWRVHDWLGSTGYVEGPSLDALHPVNVPSCNNSFGSHSDDVTEDLKCPSPSCLWPIEILVSRICRRKGRSMPDRRP